MGSREFDVLGRVARVPVRLVRAADDPATVFGLRETIAKDAERLANRDAASTAAGS
jgi:hypothetical protein